jgi:predicted metal-dependent phosphoesterase TrpH
MDAVTLIRNAGGVAVLAHPTWVKDLPHQLQKLKEAGLVGMEVYYGGYSPKTVKQLKKTADSFGLIPCGGSDYHAKDTEGESFPGDQGPPSESVDMMMSLADNEKMSGM